MPAPMTVFSKANVASDGARYVVVAGLAACLDLGVAWSAAATLGIALPIATGIGVITGGVFAYFLLEFWVYRRAESAFSWPRLSAMLAVIVSTLVLRSGTVALLALWFPHPMAEGPILIAAFALTFSLNFIFSRSVIFRRPRSPVLRQS